MLLLYFAPCVLSLRKNEALGVGGMGHVWNFEKCPNNFVTGTRTPGKMTKTRFPDYSQRKYFIPKFPDEKKGKRERKKKGRIKAK